MADNASPSDVPLSAGSIDPAVEPATDPSASAKSASTTSHPHPYHPSYLFLVILSGLVLAADLWSKNWAVQHLERDGHRLPALEIIKGRLALVLARNPGGAWGMLHDQPEKIRKPFFVLVSILAVAVIVAMYRKLDATQRALRWGLPLVLGGALGNLVDRVRFGQVVDFIDVVYWRNPNTGDVHWPTFNVADIAICVGVGLMAVDFLFPQRKVRRTSGVAKPA